MDQNNLFKDLELPTPQDRLLAFIPSGEENAVSMRDLSMWLGTSERDVRRMIERARIDGIVIAGTSAGIFIPETKEELRRYVHRTLRRVDTTLATLEHASMLLGVIGDE